MNVSILFYFLGDSLIKESFINQDKSFTRVKVKNLLINYRVVRNCCA